MSELEGVVSGDIYLKHRRKYGEAAQIATEKGSLTQQAVKAAEADGVDPDAMKMVRKLQKQEPALAAAFVRNVMTYANYESAAFMTQGDLLHGNKSLSETFAGKPPSDKGAQLWSEHQAYERGHKEAIDGGSLDNLNAQFEAGSANAAAAARGYSAGEKFMAGIPQPTKPVAGGKRAGKGQAAEAVAPEPKSDAPMPGKHDGDADFEAPAYTDRSKLPDLIKIETMSAAAICDYFNGFVPPEQQKKKFESKAHALSAVQKLYHARVASIMTHDQAAEAAPAPEPEPEADKWPLTATANLAEAMDKAMPELNEAPPADEPDYAAMNDEELARARDEAAANAEMEEHVGEEEDEGDE